MQVAIVKNNSVEATGLLKELFPQVSFPATGPDPDWMASNGVKHVSVWKPHSSSEKLVQSTPYIEDGLVYLVAVEAKTPEDLAGDTLSASAEVRARRNRMLSESDWTQGKDIPDSVSAAWAVYRQALRDIPDQDGFPHNVTWPVSP